MLEIQFFQCKSALLSLYMISIDEINLLISCQERANG